MIIMGKIIYKWIVGLSKSFVMMEVRREIFCFLCFLGNLVFCKENWEFDMLFVRIWIDGMVLY